MPGDRFGQCVISVARKRDRLGGLQLLDIRRSQRDDLHVDAGGIAQVAHQPRRGYHLARLLLEVAVRAEKARCGEMLFKRYGTHGLDSPLPPDAIPEPDFPRSCNT